MDVFETELTDALRDEARNAPKFGDWMTSGSAPVRSTSAWRLMAASAAVAAAIIVPVVLAVGDIGDEPRVGGFADGPSSAPPTAAGSENTAPLDQRVNDTVDRLKHYRSRVGFGALVITYDVVTVLWDGPAPSDLQLESGLQSNGTTIRVATSPLTSAQINAAERAIIELAARHDVALLSYGPTADRGAVLVEINMAESPPDAPSAATFAESVSELSVPVRIDYIEGNFIDR